MSVNLSPRGRTFTRAVMLKAAGLADRDALHEVAATHWGPAQAEVIARAAVAPLSADDVGTDAAAQEFIGLVRERTIYGRLSGLRKVPFNLPVPRITSGATGYWVGEAKPKPLSKPAVTGSALERRKVVAMIAFSAESLRMGHRNAESTLQDDLIRAVGAAWDEAFIDPANTGEAEVRPASITSSAATIVATADPAADLELLFAAFEGDFSAAYLIMHPGLAIRLAKRRAGTSFAFPDIGPRGGSLLGIPVLTSRGVPEGMVALVDPTGIAAADDGLEVASASQSMLAMSDDPEAEPEMVSLYQHNLIALRAEAFTNWEVQRPGSVAVITGADYSAAA